MELVYRKLTVRDIDMVMKMNDSFREGFACYANAVEFLSNPNNWLFAAVEGETIVGFAYGYELSRLNDAGNMLYIHEVGVMEAYQRRGVGTGLMTALKAACAAQGMSKCFLSAYQSNAGANALYRKVGGQVSEASGGDDVNYYFSLQ
jgi:ribosomal protein S18 acetylase RimI-like enzyme